MEERVIIGAVSKYKFREPPKQTRNEKILQNNPFIDYVLLLIGFFVALFFTIYMVWSVVAP